jgi:hypothetical protein
MPVIAINLSLGILLLEVMPLKTSSSFLLTGFLHIGFSSSSRQ